MNPLAGIDDSAPPSGEGCADCSSAHPAGWWLPLRRCAQGGHVGCCGSSPSQHATAHFRTSGHRVVQRYEPGEDGFYDYVMEAVVHGPPLPEPTSHPPQQAVPGPSGRVPVGWRNQLH